MKVAADTTNLLTQKKGNHKGCPYDGMAGGYFQGNDRMCGCAGRGEGPSSRGFFENLLHGVAFCCIFLVIVKFTTSPGALDTGQVWEARAWFSLAVSVPYRVTSSLC